MDRFKDSSSISVRRALLVCLGLLVAATTGTIGFVWEGAQEASGKAWSDAFLRESQLRAESAAANLVDPVHDALVLHWRQMKAGVLVPDDADSARLQLLPAMRSMRHVRSSMVGSPEGYQHLVMAYDGGAAASAHFAGRDDVPPFDPDGPQLYFTRIYRRNDDERADWTMWDGEGGTPLARWSSRLPGYDPAARPWCVEAVNRLLSVEKRGGSDDPAAYVAWTNVYKLYTTQSPGVSGVVAVRRPDGKIDVVAYDVLLDVFTNVVCARAPTRNGKIFVVDSENRLLGLPSGAAFADAGARAAAYLRTPEELGDGPLSAWSEFVRYRRGTEDASYAEFEHDGVCWLGGMRSFKLGADREFRIGVLLPRAEVLELVGHDRFLVAKVGLVGLAIAVVGAFLIARGFSRPLKRLVEESERLGKLDLERRPAPRFALTEVRRLAESLAALRDSLDKRILERDAYRRDWSRGEERFKSVFEAAPIGIAALDLEGRVLFGNPELSRITSCDGEQLLGASLREFIHPDEREAAWARHAGPNAPEGVAVRADHRCVARDGTIKWVGCSTVLSRPKGDDPGGIVAVLKDLSERRALEEQLREAQRLDAVGRLAGGLAHDLNNLLTAIAGHASLAREEPATAAENVEQIERASDAAARLIKQVLTFARRGRAGSGVCDVVATIKDSTPMVRQLVGPRARVETDVADEALFAQVDAVQFQQVLANLAVNARDALPDGGVFSISARRDAADPTFVAITVTDDGLGMSEAVRSRVFEPFFTTKPTGRGTGLGLSVCYGIVKDAGGTIEVESEPGRGARFTVRLPLHGAPLQESAEAADDVLPVGNGERVVVVDDDRQVGALVRKILNNRGFTATLFENGASALHAIANGPRPDLVLTDVIMPRVGGVELARRIKEAYPTMRVMLMTGYAEPRDLAADETLTVLQKPFTPNALVAAVRKALDEGGGPSSAPDARAARDRRA